MKYRVEKYRDWPTQAEWAETRRNIMRATEKWERLGREIDENPKFLRTLQKAYKAAQDEKAKATNAK